MKAKRDALTQTKESIMKAYIRIVALVATVAFVGSAQAQTDIDLVAAPTVSVSGSFGSLA
jgi:precorrin isomerase